MTHGFDTSFLVAAEVLGHANHQASRSRLQVLRSAGDNFAVAPQVLAEFVHVVTDPRRFSQPLSIDAALSRAEAWWTSTEVMQVFPTSATLTDFFDWMRRHRLGRDRILDTLLAATYRAAGIGSLLTTNARDFSVFNVFQVITP
jgi:predicted nucleic acid-binding protein